MMWRFLTDGSMAVAELALTCVIQSTALLVVGLLAGRLSRRPGPAVQSAVYRTTLASVLLCPCASMLLAAMGCGGMVLPLPSQLPTDGVTESPVAPNSTPASALDTRSGPSPTQIRDELREPIAAATTVHYTAAPGIETTRAIESTPSAPAVPKSDHFPPWLSWCVLAGLSAWLMGSILLGARLAAGQWRMARLRSGAIPAGTAIEALCAELARGMSLSTPAVLRSPFLSSPCLDGLRRPVILLPEDCEASLRETLIHELAHLARRDGFWNLLRRVSTAAFWVQPLLWVLSRRLEVTAEEVCDDYVVQFGADRARYAGHLLELAERTLPPLAPSGVGMISLRSLLARRVTRILDSSRTLSTRAGARAVTATVLAGLIGTLLAGLLGVGSGDRQVLGDEAQGEKLPAALGAAPNLPARTKTVRGRVVGPDGKPFAGATVTIARYRRAATDPYFSGSGSHWKPDRQEMDRARSDADGRFRLTFEDREIGLAEERDSPDRWDMPLIVAWAPGFGPDWVEGDVTEEHPLRLIRDDVPINGRIIDLEGRPVAGAAVRVHRLESPESAEAVERWLKAAASKAAGDERWFPSSGRLTGDEPAVSAPVTTDSDGRFRLNGLGRDRMATVEISGRSITLRRVQVVTRQMKRVGGGPVDRAQLIELDYHGADCTIAVEPGRPIEGMVRDAETKEPIPGAIVTAMQLFASTLSIEGMIATTTDGKGRYRLAGLPKGNGHKLSVYPALDRPYFITEFLEVPVSPGLGPVHYDIALKRGIWISGRVTDAKTGQPVQAAIHYYPFLANKHAEGYPNFRAGLSLFWTGSRYRTDAEGRYRVVGLPGRGIVAVKSFDQTYRVGVGVDRLSVQPGARSDRSYGLPTYNAIDPREFEAVAEVDPPADVLEAGRDFLLERGMSLTVQVVEPDGKPLTEVMAEGRSAVPRMGDTNLHEQTRFQVVGLDPKVSRTVVFEHRIRKLGATLVIKPGDLANAGERIVTLRPCATVTGRLVDAEGKPVRGGIERHMYYGANNEESTVFQPENLDADGRFRIDDLAPGAKYTLWAKDPADYRVDGERERVFRPFAIVSNLTALSGQVFDVGTFNAMRRERIQNPEKPAVIEDDRGKAEARSVPINGRIIDLEGRPVAGATVQIVSYNTSRTGDLTRWLDAVRSAQTAITARQYLNHLETPATALKATTDQQGRFRFESIGAERIAHLLLEGPTIASAFFTVVTRPIESFPAHDPASFAGQGTETIYGADFTFSGAPGRPIEGIVRDARTKQGLAAVVVRSARSLRTIHAAEQKLEAATNEQGRFRLVGLSKARTSPRVTRDLLTLIPNDEQPYFMRNIPIPDPPGLEPVLMEIDLHRGIWITGKVSDKKTGNPINGVPLHFLPFLENKFAQATPEFGPNRSVLVIVRDRYKTKPDGTYRLVGLPGRAIVGVAPWDRVPYRFGYGADSIKGKDEHGQFATWWNPFPAGETSLLSMKEINPPEGAEVVHLDLELDSGASVHVRVVDREGKPLPGSGVIRRMSTNNLETMPEAEFDVVALGPAEERGMLLWHEGRKLGKAVRIHPGDDKAGPVMVTLEPLATIVGRVVDADGNPVAGATVRGDMLPFGRNDPRLSAMATGKDGRFQVPDVPAGVDYSLTITSGRNVTGRRTVTIQTKVRPGETTDVGEIRLKGN